MSPQLRPVALAALAVGCVAPDGDLSATPALVAMSLDATTDQLAQRTTVATGQVELGYTDTQLVRIDLFDNGVPVATLFEQADAPKLSYQAELDLLYPDVNALTALATYHDDTIGAAVSIPVPGALQAFAATAPATASSLDVVVDGTAALGFVSDAPANLVIAVDGAVVASRSLDASSVDLAFSEPIVLPAAGPNTVQATLSYEGHVRTASSVVTVEPPDPTVTLPAWSTTFTPGVAMIASGTVDVTAPAPWTVDGVRTSSDGGATWTAATAGPGTGWLVEVRDPDILGHDVLFAVDTSHRGVRHTTTWPDRLLVDPVFACNSPLSMSPETEMVSDHNWETRAMLGYFGDPEGGHDVSFVVDVAVPFDGPYRIVGNLQSYGRFAIGTQFNVDQLDCGGDCTMDYDLEVYVDGVLLCAETNFGVIREY